MNCPEKTAQTQTTFFIDFDGTITTLDTTTAMLRAFVAKKDRPAILKINALWEQKLLSTQECANQTFKYFKADMDDMLALLETIEIDASFKEFLERCRSAGDRIYVLSDGFDLSIQTVFHKYALDLPFYANVMVFGNGFRVKCPLANPECGQCGVCKTSLMQHLRETATRCIYIGDGYSDTCPARHADMVFAKEPLYTLCKNNGVAAVKFESFREIIAQIY